MAFMQLLGWFTGHAVHHAPALHRGAGEDGFRPALHILVFMHGKEFRRAIQEALHQPAIPGPNGDIGDGIIITAQIGAFREPPVQHIQLPLGFHRKAINRVFDLHRRIGIEMPKAAAQIWRAAHLPE